MDWPVGLTGDLPVVLSNIIIIFLNFAIKWQLILFGRGPLLLPQHRDSLKISEYRINHFEVTLKITLK